VLRLPCRYLPVGGDLLGGQGDGPCDLVAVLGGCDLNVEQVDEGGLVSEGGVVECGDGCLGEPAGLGDRVAAALGEPHLGFKGAEFSAEGVVLVGELAEDAVDLGVGEAQVAGVSEGADPLFGDAAKTPAAVGDP